MQSAWIFLGCTLLAGTPSETSTPEAADELVLTKPPELIEFVDAEYPTGMLDAGIGGEVLLVLDIGADGTVTRVQVAEATHPDFAAPAMEAAAGFIFSPAEINSEPAAIRIEYRYVFEAREPPKPAEPEEPEAAPAPVNFVGTVREAAVRVPIAGAGVYVNGELVAETATDGSFEARGVPNSVVNVRIVTPRYETYEAEEELAEGERLEASYYLVPKSRNPFETVVRTRVEQREVTRVQLAVEEVTKVPGTFGDPVRVIESLPGMARVPGGFGGALVVRGANPADSAVLIDGVPVPTLYHGGMLTSVINPELIDSVDFMPGGFGARYGKATAGAVEVTSRDLDCDMYRGVIDVDFVDAGAYLCAPVGDWKVAAAVRRSYIDAILPFVFDGIERASDESVMTVAPAFLDYQLKTQGKIGSHEISAMAFGSHDTLGIVQSSSAEDADFNVDATEGFHVLYLRHRYRFGAGASLTSTLSSGWELWRTDVGSEDLGTAETADGDIVGLQLREDLVLPIAEWLTLRAGLDHVLGTWRADFDIALPSGGREFPTSLYDSSRNSPYYESGWDLSQGYWAEAELAPLKGLKLVPGLRLDRLETTDASAWTLAPRIAGRWEFLDGSTVKAAYGMYHKLPEPNIVVPGFGQPNLDAERAQHFVLGFEQRLGEALDLDVEGFYIMRDHLPSPSSEVVYEDGKAKPVLWTSTGTGRSYGAEVMLRRPAMPGSRFYGWIAYTLSRTTRTDRSADGVSMAQTETSDPSTPRLTDPEAQQREYLSPFDQTHILTVVAQWQLPWGFEVGGRFQLVSGNPSTPLDKAEVYYDADLDQYLFRSSSVGRNSDRMPTYHRLDLRIDRHFLFDTWKLTAYLEVLNVYNQRNVETIAYDYRYRDTATVATLPIIPVLGVKGTF